jgi:hypothetical protein
MVARPLRPPAQVGRRGVASDKSLLIADSSNDRIRRVASDGTITTVAGTGTHDGGAARRARMNHPAAVATRADGSVLIADIDNHRIRLVEPLDEGSDWLDDFGR